MENVIGPILRSHKEKVEALEARIKEPAQHVHVDLNTMPGLDAAIVGRWAPIIATLLPEFRTILLARVAPRDAPLDGEG